ncbi:hypothetical protein ACIBO2_00925 [Nonomuraea sp. NPDC050022]|uniref:hypothetical protein n=1 Tax=Nonomuraea sp. NPDC050022 TaxID=3364358 RepID=UPI0037BD5766
MTWDVTAMARQWAGDAANYGMVLMSPNENNSANYRVYPSSENPDGLDVPMLSATFSPLEGPVTVQPAGSGGVEVFTAPANWKSNTLQMAEAQAHALSVAQDRVDANPAALGAPSLDMVSGQVTVPAATADGRDIGRAPLSGTAYLANGATDWSVAGEYVGEVGEDDGDGPANLSEPFTFSPTTPDVANSAARLTEIVDEVLGLTTEQMPSADLLVSAFIWPERNLVVLQAPSVTPELRQALAARYGLNAVAIWLQPSARQPAADVLTRSGPRAVSAMAGDSRDNDTDGYINGGSRYFGSPGGECTTGWAWGKAADMLLLVGGHCMPMNGGRVARRVDGNILGALSVYPEEDSNWDTRVGTVKLPGQSTYYGDVARLHVDYRSTASIFVGPAGSSDKRSVAGRWSRRAQDGDLYCVGGVNSGQTCNWKVAGIGWKIKNGTKTTRWVQRGTRANRCTKRGDSGAPVYTIRSSDGYVVAKGIHHGSLKNEDGTDMTENCEAYFTDIHDVGLAFGDRIMKRN